MLAESLRDLAVSIDRLRALPGNPRRGDVEAVVRSLKRFGQRKPIVARRDGTVVAGNHTLKAAQKLGWSEIAVVWVDDDDATAKAYALADNRTSALGTFDDADLASMVAEVHAVDPDLLAAASYDDADLNALLAGKEELPPVHPPSDSAPKPPADPVTKPGDVWLLGPHRIICGDSRDYETVAKLLLDGRQVNVAFTSPPYASQRKYDESSGFRPIPPDEYIEWFEDVQANVRSVLAEDGSWFVNIKEHTHEGQRHLYVKDLVVSHVRRWGWCYIDELIWHHGGTPGKFVGRFKNGFEPVFHFATGEARSVKHRPQHVMVESEHAFTYEQGRRQSRTGNVGFHGTDVERGEGLALPSNVLTLRHSGGGGVEGDIAHAAMFPVRLPAWFIKAFSDEGDAIFDPFMGSGTTLIAAHQEQRIAYGTEISPAYCDVICRRWQQHTGTLPVLQSTGESHDFTT